MTSNPNLSSSQSEAAIEKKTAELKKINRNPYVKLHRLHDVIRLISVLAVSEDSFRSDNGIKTELRDNPRSAKTWLIIANNHPEFFRLNKDLNRFILLQRYLREPAKNDKTRTALTQEDTQKLIDQAITLHDKELARYQRKGFLIPIYTALLAAMISVFLEVYKNNTSQQTILSINKRVDSLNKVLSGKGDSNKKAVKKL